MDSPSPSLVTIRYYLNVPRRLSHLRKSFGFWVEKTLGARRKGISALADVKYKETKRKENADIIARLVPQSYINKRCGFSKLSCSLVSPDEKRPDEILFSLENWMGGSDYDGELNQYRRYLVNHEFLHCRPFRLDHPHAKAVGMYCTGRFESRPLPVMYQQSRGHSRQTRGCHYNSWPLAEEFESALEESE
jgi:hypothetical protein